VNILLLGSDRRSGTGFRTDTILLLSIQPSAHGAALISIPRDLYLYLPGYSMQRVNTAFELGDSIGYPGGGRALLADTLLYNLGLTFDFYARVEMSGFEQIVQKIDGIDVRVSCPYTDWRLKSPNLNPNVETNWALYTVHPGVVSMDGDLALWYARSRQKSSDFDRARRQQEVLRAIYRQGLQLGLLSQIPELYQDLSQAITTDMSLSDMLRLAPLATSISPSSVRSRFIGRDQVTSWRTPSGAQILLPKPAEIQALLSQTLDLRQGLPAESPRLRSIQVINASGKSGWGDLAAERLTYAGFEASVDPSPAAAQTATTLIDFGVAPSGTRTDVASAIGLSPGAVQINPQADSPFAFQLTVGENYRPCFNPTLDQLGNPTAR
jgi:LCP family protein required for cell wall assembly